MARQHAQSQDTALPLIFEPVATTVHHAVTERVPAVDRVSPSDDLVAAGPTPRQPRNQLAVSLELTDSMWVANGVLADDDGELLDSLAASGPVPSEGPPHAGWLLAACAALQWIETLPRKPVLAEIGIPLPGPVGFLVVSIPARIQRATWDEDLRSRPWPELYQTFADLQERVRARIRWAPDESLLVAQVRKKNL